MAYRITINGVPAYDQRKAFKNFHVLSPVWTQELKKADKLTFTLPHGNYGYNMPRTLTHDVVLYDDDTIVFRGRVLKVKRTMWGDKQVTCEGDMGFLNDSIMAPFTFQGGDLDFVRYVLGVHNAQVETDRRILADQLGTSAGTSTLDITTDDYMSCFDALMTYWKHELGSDTMSCLLYTDWTESGGAVTSHMKFAAMTGDSQTDPAALGKNLLDLSEVTSGEDIYTAMIPLGADYDTGNVDENGDPIRLPLTIVSANNIPAGFTHNGIYLSNNAGTNAFGWIARVMRFPDVDPDDYATFPEVANVLVQEAAAEFGANLAETLTMEASALDLKRAGLSTKGFKLGYLTRVRHALLGIDAAFICSRIELPLDAPEKAKYRFGDARSTMTDMLGVTDRTVSSVQRAVEKAQNAAANAQTAVNSTDTAIAGDYDEDEAYAKGDVVLHNHKLYIAAQDIAAGEGWVPTHWTVTDLNSLLKSRYLYNGRITSDFVSETLTLDYLGHYLLTMTALSRNEPVADSEVVCLIACSEENANLNNGTVAVYQIHAGADAATYVTSKVSVTGGTNGALTITNTAGAGEVPNVQVTLSKI